MSIRGVMQTTWFRVALGMLVWLLSVLISMRPVPEGEVALSWAFLPVSALTIAHLWDGHGWPDRRAWALILTLISTMWVGGFLQGLETVEVTWVVVTQMVATTIVLKTYATLLGSTRAPLRSTADLLVVVLATLAAVGASGFMGGFPGMAVAPGSPFAALTWDDSVGWLWMARSLTFSLVGFSTFQFLFHGTGINPDLLRRPSWKHLTLLCLLGPVAVFVALTNLDLPLTWLMLIPAVWAGTVLSPVRTAAYSLAIGASVNVLTYLPVYSREQISWAPFGSIIDVLVAAACLIGIQVSLVSTERSRALMRARSSRKRSQEQATLLGHVFDSMSDGLAVIDSEGVVARQNRALGRLVLPAFTAEDFQPVPGKVLRERGISLTDGRELRLFSDVTDEHARLDKLQAMARSVANDLQDPLDRLNAHVDLAIQCASGIGGPITSMLDKADAAGSRMDQVLADWLHSTVDNEGDIAMGPVRLAPLLSEVVAHYNGPQISVHTPHTVVANAGMLRQVLANLVSNSVKYTPADRIPTIRVTSQRDARSGMVEIHVQDNGIGLLPGEETRIFDEFHRSPGAAQQYEGTGVGLATCRRIVHRHGGQIWATTHGEGIPGATLTFTLRGAHG